MHSLLCSIEVHSLLCRWWHSSQLMCAGDPHPGNLLKITEGSHAGKLALLDFGLVAEIPAADRDAMVSATIHLANKDWDALINDFAALGFLPHNSNKAVIVPVMDKVLSPYLRGGGARSFNFQALSQDLLAATLEIPFSVPPYMSLLARSVATLEGIALLGDPNYQMVAQAYPFVVRKVRLRVIRRPHFPTHKALLRVCACCSFLRQVPRIAQRMRTIMQHLRRLQVVIQSAYAQRCTQRQVPLAHA